MAATAPAATNAPRDFLVSNWRTEDGLPHSGVNCLLQTRDGYLWIGTYVGVVRFDGVRFVHFSTANLPQLGPGRVSCLFEDRNNVLWIGLESGRLLAWKGTEIRVHLQNSDPPNQAIVAMAQDQAGTLWLQTSSGRLGRLTSDSVEFVATTGGSLMRSSLGLLVDAEGRLWVGTKDGLKVWREGGLTTPPGMAETPNEPLDAFALARGGGVWTYRARKLQRLKEGVVAMECPAPVGLNSPVVNVLEARDGRVWLAAGDSGNLFCRESSGEWRAIAAELGLQGGNRVLCEDREGNLWRGGFGSGLTRLRPKLFAVHELPATEPDRYALGISADAAGNVWALFNARWLGRCEPGATSFQLSSAADQNLGFRTLFTEPGGALWLSTGDGHVYRRTAGRFVRELEMRAPPDFVSAFYQDSKSNLWVGFTGGAGVGYMPQSDPKAWRELKGLSLPDVRCITEAADGAMWFGTHYGGAFRWQNEEWTRFTGRDGLPSDYVRAFLADADGTIWLGTIHGLCRWREGRFTPITSANGLWHDSISHIADDGQGHLWLSSFGGIFRVARAQLNEFADGRLAAIQCIGYGRHDGLPALECPGGFQPAGARTPDGRLWFPTVSGVISVAPREIQENTQPPPVWIEELTVDGKSRTLEHSVGVVNIPPGKRRFDFRFTALSLSAPAKVRFRHKLDGLDQEWSRPDDQRTVTYNYIPAGQYTFRVMACNNDGIWNEAGHALTLIVEPFPWQTWWFKTGVGVVLVAALIVGVRRAERWKARLRLERLEQQHAVERERSRIAKDIHDDLGANLTQIVFLSQRADDSAHEAKDFRPWLQQIPATARRTIQSLDEIVWAINPKHDSLESLANYLSQFAQEHLTLAGVRCVLDVPTVLPSVVLSAEIRHNLLLAAREALQNVVAHAAATEVRVALRLDPSGLNIVIADNGRGFESQLPPRDGNGLHNIRRRLADIGGEADISSQPGGGTTVRLRIPAGRLHGRVIGGDAPSA